jgi:hypothetical protein
MEPIITTIWDGWQVTATAIYSPEGQIFYPADLRARQYDKALIAEYQKLHRQEEQQQQTAAQHPIPLNVLQFRLTREKIVPTGEKQA